MELEYFPGVAVTNGPIAAGSPISLQAALYGDLNPLGLKSHQKDCYFVVALFGGLFKWNASIVRNLSHLL